MRLFIDNKYFVLIICFLFIGYFIFSKDKLENKTPKSKNCISTWVYGFILFFFIYMFIEKQTVNVFNNYYAVRLYVIAMIIFAMNICGK